MLIRMLGGVIKGVVLGALLAVGLGVIGFAVPPAWLAYVTAALAGMLVGLVAGKPIWAEGGKIEAGLKAGFGAILSVGLLFVARKYLTFHVPFSLGQFLSGRPGFGEAALTSLPAVSGLIGAFYDADNTPETAPAERARIGEGKRVATADPIEAEGESARSKKSRTQ